MNILTRVQEFTDYDMDDFAEACEIAHRLNLKIIVTNIRECDSDGNVLISFRMSLKHDA